jgi:hypothetical protein
MNGYKYLLIDEERDAADCLEANEHIEVGNILICDEKTGMFHKFELYNEYEAAYSEGPYLTHEVILSWMKQKPKFDMDSGTPALYTDLLETIETAFEETYGLIPEFIHCDSSNETKFSRHIIVNNAHFINSQEADHFTNVVLKPLLTDD